MTFASMQSPPAPSVASSSKINRLSTSSTTSHASTSSACPSFAPSRDSVYSTSSDGWSAPLVTPRGECSFEFEVLNDANYEDEDDRVEYIDLAEKETWWNAAPKNTSRSVKHAAKVEENPRWLDDSPTLPASSVLPDVEIMPSITLNPTLSKKKLGKQPIRPSTPISDLESRRVKESENCIFDIFGTENSNRIDQDVFASIPIRRAFTKRRLPLPTFSNDSSTPTIPTRGSSKRPPILPLRASSLKAIPTHSTPENPFAGPSRPTHTHRPTPVRTFSHPPPSTSHRSSLKKNRRISPVLLQPISETPKDLDVSPDGSWALRRSPPKLGLSKSQPNLRNSNNNNLDMTMKFRLKRSNSSNDNTNEGNDFMSRDSFPSSRNSLDVNRERDRDRSSFSDLARSFIPLPVPESPSRMSLDGSIRPSITLGTTTTSSKKSPKSNSLLGGLKKSQSQRRPSLLGLPEWSPRPNPRSISDSYVPQIPSSSSTSSSNSNSRTLEALRSGRDSPSSSSSLNLDMTKGGEKIFRRNSSRHSIASSISSKMNQYLEEDLLVVLEAENWDWPSPPFRIVESSFEISLSESRSIPGLSTSGTLESISSNHDNIEGSPQTPSESEFVLHGESEWLAKAQREKEREKQRFWRPLSLGESIESLDIVLYG